jgi:Fic family protein
MLEGSSPVRLNATKCEWKPVEDLQPNWEDLRDSNFDKLMDAWQEQAAELRAGEAYREFLIRLRRQWAIETGILERLYSLSDGATKTLIEKGFDSALIGHDDTDKDPTEVLDMIQDQMSVVEGLYAFISGERPFSKSYIRELHCALTEHQIAYDAVDTLGSRVKRAMPKGEWKMLPNKIASPDGRELMTCPPEQVEAEMDRLVQMHEEHERWHVPPYIEAAWLHHRFVCMHPFTDGNGRVARCLATLVLLKAGWFPLVVTRSDRAEYIISLRQADSGDMRRLVALFVNLQKLAIRQAWQLSEELQYEQKAVSNILSAVKNRFTQIREAEESQKKQVLTLADTLFVMADSRVKELKDEVKEAIGEWGRQYDAFCTSADRTDPRAGYYYIQIVECAKEFEYFANLQVYQAWVNLSIKTNARTEILLAIHGMGKGPTGVIACSAMYYTRQTSAYDEPSVSHVTPLSDEPFTFTYRDDPSDVQRRFRSWFDDRLILGLDRWRKSLGA